LTPSWHWRVRELTG